MGDFTQQYDISSWALKKIYMSEESEDSGEPAGWYWVIVENNKEISNVDKSVFYLPTTEESDVPSGPLPEYSWCAGFDGIVGGQNYT